MRPSRFFTLTAFVATAVAVPVSSRDDATKAALTKLAIDHPDIKKEVEVVIQAEYGGLRPAKRNPDDATKAALTKLAIDHPDIKKEVEVVIQAEYGGLRPAKRDVL